MGRHADPRDGSFRRSLAATLGRTVLLVALVAGVTALATRVGAGDVGDPVIRAPAAAPGASVGASEDLPPDPGDALEAPTSPSPLASTPPPSPAVPTEAPSTEPSPSVPPVRVQILHAAAPDAVVEDARGALEALGYEVVAVNAVRQRVAVTTALVDVEHAADAEELVRREPRVLEVGRNTRYSTDVDINLVLADDWPVAVPEG